MLAKKALEKFGTGKLGTVFPVNVIEDLEKFREQAGAAECNQKLTFDFEAVDGETIIEVTLTLRVKQSDEDEE